MFKASSGIDFHLADAEVFGRPDLRPSNDLLTAIERRDFPAIKANLFYLYDNQQEAMRRAVGLALDARGTTEEKPRLAVAAYLIFSCAGCKEVVKAAIDEASRFYQGDVKRMCPFLSEIKVNEDLIDELYRTSMIKPRSPTLPPPRVMP